MADSLFLSSLLLAKPTFCGVYMVLVGATARSNRNISTPLSESISRVVAAQKANSSLFIGDVTESTSYLIAPWLHSVSDRGLDQSNQEVSGIPTNPLYGKVGNQWARSMSLESLTYERPSYIGRLLLGIHSADLRHLDCYIHNLSSYIHHRTVSGADPMKHNLGRYTPALLGTNLLCSRLLKVVGVPGDAGQGCRVLALLLDLYWQVDTWMRPIIRKVRSNIRGRDSLPELNTRTFSCRRGWIRSADPEDAITQVD
ncbi:hypothetical protein P691DRAFT_784131 [Macrolepiota fuliginosa MF-IS2]|uniref:Uncharacterized protein n=1 Tax=Macrolepiota fuliginosa MF-IS2 TaxID=1400762 RepID=A0A9P6C2D8_9AGAR|nr:hypothetical protein P691DRAFT_784131 [Macrolepiota fuliginosa MF-IS2]